MYVVLHHLPSEVFLHFPPYERSPEFGQFSGVLQNSLSTPGSSTLQDFPLCTLPQQVSFARPSRAPCEDDVGP